MVIVPPGEEHVFQALLGDGSQWGISITYAVQLVPRGIADAMLVGAEFVCQDSVCLVLGDNIFYQEGFGAVLKQAVAHNHGATVFGYYVEDPRPFGVVEFDADGKALSIEEKPSTPEPILSAQHFTTAGHRHRRNLKPSARRAGDHRREPGISPPGTAQSELRLEQDFVWLDDGTADSVLEAAETVRDIQRDTGRYVGCIEKCALEAGWISAEQVPPAGDRAGRPSTGSTC